MEAGSAASTRPRFKLTHYPSSTPPGESRPVQPFGIAAASVAEMPETFATLGDLAQGVVARLAQSRAAAAHPDAEVIDLAGRVTALNTREDRIVLRTVRIEDEVLTAMSSWQWEDKMRGEVHETPWAWQERRERDEEARRGLPYWNKLRDRATRRLERWGLRLAAMEPATQAGLAAKAGAAAAVAEGDELPDEWRQKLSISLSRDALRIIDAEADARAEQARLVDGELLALGRAWEANCERYERACAAEEVLIDALDLIGPPEALFMREGDDSIVPAYAHPHVSTGRFWYGDDISIHSLRNSATWGCPDSRRDEIIAAHDRWRADIAAEDERSGLRAARAEREAVVAEGAAIRARICLMRAHTQAGIDLKVRVVLWLQDGLDNLLADFEPSNLENPEFTDAVAMSIVLDLACQRQAAAQPVALDAGLARVA